MRCGCLVVLPRVRASFMEQRLEQPSTYHYCYSQGTAASDWNNSLRHKVHVSCIKRMLKKSLSSYFVVHVQTSDAISLKGPVLQRSEFVAFISVRLHLTWTFQNVHPLLLPFVLQSPSDVIKSAGPSSRWLTPPSLALDPPPLWGGCLVFFSPNPNIPAASACSTLKVILRRSSRPAEGATSGGIPPPVHLNPVTPSVSMARAPSLAVSIHPLLHFYPPPHPSFGIDQLGASECTAGWDGNTGLFSWSMCHVSRASTARDLMKLWFVWNLICLLCCFYLFANFFCWAFLSFFWH